MTNGEEQMTKEIQKTNDERTRRAMAAQSFFDFQYLDFLRHLLFVIRHAVCPSPIPTP
jgi:hypothetical protein